MEPNENFHEDNERINDPSQQNKRKRKRIPRKNSTLRAATLVRSASAQVERHSDRGLANTGTNISYEGPTAPGAGGSVGTGYASGKEAVDETIRTNSDFVQNRAAHPSGRHDVADDASADDNTEEPGFIKGRDNSDTEGNP